MVAQVNLATASLGLLIFDATNRKPVALVAVVQARIVAVVVQDHAVRVIAIVISRTPEVRVVALVVEMPIAAPAASRQRREGIGIRTVAATVPAASGLEHLARRRLAPDCGKQRIPFRLRRQVPALGTNTTHRIRRRACFTIAATLAIRAPRARTVHRSSPRVKATVFGAVGCVIAVAVTVRRFVIQVLSHPRLRAYSNGLVGMTVAGVGYGSFRHFGRLSDLTARRAGNDRR